MRRASTGWGADQSCYYSEDSQYPGRECRNTCTGDYVAKPRSRGGGFFSFFRGGRLVEESANAPKSPRLLPVAAAASARATRASVAAAQCNQERVTWI